MDFTPLKTHILIYNMLKTPELTQRTNFKLVARRSECSVSRFDLKNELYAPEILMYNMLKTPKLTQRTNLQLVARRSECSVSRFDLKNELYTPENQYFDI